ncbi:unnamed protein product [Schistosoma mattheei]|uniref:Uncharacterized protein n=1 Tax=Schistosoma mattheei TaxID=31246 RepID=A0A183PYZ0_9TREM|nr:unnamed protein product [Schistosoma mattheei]
MSIHPSINMKSRHIEYEKSLKMDCQNAALKFSHKFMNLSNFYYNHIKNKSLIKIKGIDENYNGIYNNLQENKLNYSMELLDVNYPNEFLQEIHHLYKLTLSSVSSSLSSSASLSSSNGISSKFIRSTFTNEQVICQCDILKSTIINRLLEIQSCLVYGDQLTLMMIEQIMFDLFEIQLPNQSVSNK